MADTVLMRIVILALMMVVTGCQAVEESAEVTADVVEEAPAVSQTGDPYTFLFTSYCWANEVKTNGPSYGTRGNSGYLCHSTDLSPAENAADRWIGFYRNNTISIRSIGGTDYTYPVQTIVFSHTGTGNCMLRLLGMSDALRHAELSVAAPHGDFDADGFIDSMWYSDVDTGLNTTVTCEYREKFGQ